MSLSSRLLHALYSWPIFLVHGLLCFLVLTTVQVLAWPFDRHVGVRWGARLWGRGVYACQPGFTLEREGFDAVTGGPYVIVSNHASHLDIPALMHLPLDFRVVARRSLFKIPFLGWFMSLSGQVASDPGDPEATLRRCREELARGRSVLVFPEGTRSVDGRVGRFKVGAFQVAMDAGVPVLVCAVEGNRHVLGKGRVLPGPAGTTVRAVVLGTQEPAAHTSPREMSRAAQAQVSQAIQSLQEGLAP